MLVKKMIFAGIGILGLTAGGAGVLVASGQTGIGNGGVMSVEEHPGGPQRCDVAPAVFEEYNRKAVVANVLGITEEELEDYFDEGYRPNEIAEELGLEWEDVMIALQETREALIQGALANGDITQEQADCLTEQGDGPRPGGRPGPGGPRGGLDFIDRKALLANALGITEEELEAYHEEGLNPMEIAEDLGLDWEADVVPAIEAGVEAAINAALANGEITQEQADALLNREGGFGPGGHRGGPGGGGFGFIDRKALLADALGITEEELEAYHEEGLNPMEIAEDLGLDWEADVVPAIEASFEEAVNQAVEDGLLTQEQADDLLNGVRPFGPDGQGGGPRGGGPRGQNNNNG